MALKSPSRLSDIPEVPVSGTGKGWAGPGSVRLEEQQLWPSTGASPVEDLTIWEVYFLKTRL